MSAAVGAGGKGDVSSTTSDGAGVDVGLGVTRCAAQPTQNDAASRPCPAQEVQDEGDFDDDDDDVRLVSHHDAKLVTRTERCLPKLRIPVSAPEYFVFH